MMREEALRLTPRKRAVLGAVVTGEPCEWISPRAVARIASALWEQGALEQVVVGRPSDVTHWALTSAGRRALLAPPGCIICGGPVPDPAPSSNKPRNTCDACLPEAHRRGAALSSRPRPIPATRVCSRCHTELDVNLENFSPERRDPTTGEVVRFARWCRECKKQAQRERHANATAEEREAWRLTATARYRARYHADPAFAAKERRRRRRWYANHRENAARSSALWIAKVRADPERYEAFLANQRIDYRLRRLRRGLPVRDEKRRAAPEFESDPDRGGVVPVSPLRDWIELTFPDEPYPAIASALGLSDDAGARRVCRWLTPEQCWAFLDHVDAALLGYGEPWLIGDLYPNLGESIVPSIRIAMNLDPDRVLAIGFQAAADERMAA